MGASKYSKKRQQQICERVSKGEPGHVAAQCCGVSRSTHYVWMKRGLNGKKPYVDYLDAIKKAEARAEADLLKTIQQAGTQGHKVTKIRTIIHKDGDKEVVKEVIKEVQVKRHWQAAAWLLERTRDGYSRPVQLDEALTVVAKAIAGGEQDIAKKLVELLETKEKVS